MDLGRLDEAEAAAKRSLELEPDSEVARNELEYIADLRRQREEKKKEIPWFMHSLVKPPTDPPDGSPVGPGRRHAFDSWSEDSRLGELLAYRRRIHEAWLGGV